MIARPGVPCRGCGRPFNPALDLTPLGFCQRCALAIVRLIMGADADLPVGP